MVSKTLDGYFETLDSVPVSPVGMFKSLAAKERYETAFMYAFRKLQAAEYHYNNIKQYQEKDKRAVQKTLSPGPDDPRISSVAKASRSADHYVYELSAFLEALKSSVDFLATACSPHLPGVKLDSIRTLMRLAKKGKTGPVYDEVATNLEWLEKLRSYRHHVVHRRIITVNSGHESRTVRGITKTTMYPVIIPESPPPYVPDTREIRMLRKEPSNLDHSYLEVTGFDENGKAVTFDHSFDYQPAAGFITIEHFMDYHLDSVLKFFTAIIERLARLNFQV